MRTPVLESVPKQSPCATSATLADVARTAGVSRTTASHALRGKHRVSGETIQRVQAAATALGYQGNPLARALAGGFNERSVALVTFALDQGTLIWRLNDIQHRLRQNGYRPVVYVLEEVEEQAAFISSICDQRPRAILCDFGGHVPLHAATAEALHRYQEAGGILVTYSVQTALRCDQVILNRHGASYTAAKNLIAAGHRRLGIRHHGSVSADWHGGFLQAVTEAGMDPKSVWTHYEGNYEMGGALLASDFLALPLETRPTGLYIINDVSAAAFVAALYRVGLHVPKDVSVIGHDNSPAARFGLVPLSATDAATEQLSEKTVNFFLARASGEASGPPRRLDIMSDFINRDSIAPPHK